MADWIGPRWLIPVLRPRSGQWCSLLVSWRSAVGLLACVVPPSSAHSRSTRPSQPYSIIPNLRVLSSQNGNVQAHMAVFSYHGEMAISMSKTIKEERFRWVLPIIQKEIRLVDAIKVCPYGKRSLERWLAAYRKGGEAALEPKSTA